MLYDCPMFSSELLRWAAGPAPIPAPLLYSATVPVFIWAMVSSAAAVFLPRALCISSCVELWLFIGSRVRFDAPSCVSEAAFAVI